MDQNEYRSTKIKELVDSATAMAAGNLDLIEGIRRICRLRFAVGDPDNEVFLAIRGMESETDHFPIGSARSGCSLEYLKKIDAETEKYLLNARGDILKACKDIINVFS